METKTQNITRTGILLALTLAIQFIRLPQLITGTGVNAMLLIAAMTVGVVQGSLIGCITPIVALMVGIMKPAMAPVLPFIAVSNVILVVIFHYVRNKNTYVALIAAAFVKFLILFGATKLILSSILPKPIYEKVAVTFGITQFFTALAGGVLALIIVPFIKNYMDKGKNTPA